MGLKIASGFIYKKFSFFIHSDDQTSAKFPAIWASFFKKENAWKLLGSMYVLDSFIPKKIRKVGFKSLEECLSYMIHIYDKKADPSLMIKINKFVVVKHDKFFHEYPFIIHDNHVQKTKARVSKK